MPRTRVLLLALLMSAPAARAAGQPSKDKARPAAPAASQPAPSQPAPSPPTSTAPAATEPAVDVDALRREYLALRDQLFRSRARAAAVASALYSSKLRISLDYGSGRFYTVVRATIRLDGANLYDDSQGAIAADRAPRWDGFVAPGRHMIAVRIEATGKDDRRFATALETSFAVDAPAGKDLIVHCAAADEGDIAYEWRKGERGTYKLRLDVSIASEKPTGGSARGGRRADR